MKCAVLVVAAGRGSRFGAELPKQYLPLDGRPVLRHSLAAFAAHPAVDSVRAVIHPDDAALYEQAATGLNILPPVHGGAERQDSVRAGLESLSDLDPDVVLIHDGARPYVDRAVINRVLSALADNAGALPGVPVADTLKRTEGNVVTATVSRDGLWRAQTPQGFRYGDILAAHRAAAGLALTDDAAVLEHSGGQVVMVEGDPRNVKITTPGDLQDRPDTSRVFEPRVGTGFDVHALADGDHVTLCGVKVPHAFSLAGHSDADVAIHALADAIYGALGAGDIGRLFPPSDMRWKGCPSDVFLCHARDLVLATGGRIGNVDVTIICEAPKIGPHRAAMVERLAAILNLPPGRVSVKATTTEGLGFTGRREGIAAQALATVYLPAEAAE